MCSVETNCDLDGRCQPLDSSQGKLYGYVMKIEKTGAGLSVMRGRPMAGALVRVEDTDPGEATADEHGYYEILVAPGEYVVEASHTDCREGRATCRVGPGGHVECDVPVYGEKIVIQGGCATSGEAGRGFVLAVAILLLGLRRRTGRSDNHPG